MGAQKASAHRRRLAYGASAGITRRRALAVAIAGIVIAGWPLERTQAADDVAFRLQLAQTVGSETPRIAVLSTVVAEPASQMPLQIRVAPTESIPRNSFLRLRGLPPTASLSEGHSIAPGAWAIPLNGLPRLRLNLPASASGKSDLLISLVDEDGKLLAEARVSLVIQPQTPASASPAPAAVDKERMPASPPPRAQAPALTPADRENAEKLVARGERDLDQGNIAQARQFFLRAAQIGLAQGALMLAATYDPRELARMRAVSVQPNIAEARKWYMRAVELGAPDAAHKLATLGGN
jgi:TPR repeat protein